MKKKQIINQFAKEIIAEEQRKNRVTVQQISCTLITAALELAFVNESCKSSGEVSKSQVIYRKLDGATNGQMQESFQKATIKFLKLLKLFSRNRKFIISFDTTKEAFYGEYSKAGDKLYLHAGSIERESECYYEYLTTAITCNVVAKYIIDGIIVPRGFYQEDYVQSMAAFIKEHLPIDVLLFDRGFGSWGVIYALLHLKVSFLIFWKKEGKWHKPYFASMKDGEFRRILRTKKYNRHKANYKVNCHFVLVKQLEYEGKKFDWIFATSLNLKSAASYVKRYKKRWGIETIYRVTDDIRIYTTSTKAVVRCFLFLFTCFVYNIWKFFQLYLGEDFTLSNCKVNLILYMSEKQLIHPKHFSEFKRIANKFL